MGVKGNLIISHAAQLVTPRGFEARKGEEMSRLDVIPDGALVIEGGVVSRVGRSGDVLAGLDTSLFTVIDASGRAVLPGFVDCHTHLVFGGYRPQEFSWRLGGLSYMEIMERGGGIVSTVDQTRKCSLDELKNMARARLNSMLAFGVTMVEGKSGYGLDHDTEIKQLQVMAELDQSHPIDVIATFLGAHALPRGFEGKGAAFIDFLVTEVLPDVARLGVARFCDVFCEKGVFSVEESRRLLEAARSLGLGLKLHADEITPLGGAELAAEVGAISADHLLHASDEGIRAMAEKGVVAVLLPGTAFSLKEPYARARFMMQSGCAVALATDFNPGSCFSESIPLVIALATIYMGMTPEETVTALTLNGAAAVGKADVAGSLDVGKQGDAVILEYPSYLYLPYHIGVNSVETVIKRGDVVYDRHQRRAAG